MKQLIIIFLIVVIIGITKMKLSFGIVHSIFISIYHLYISTGKFKHNRILLDYTYQNSSKKVLNHFNILPVIYGKFINKPKLIICNHHTWLDGGLIKYAYPHFLTIAKHDSNKEFFLNGIVTEFLNRWGSILYKRGNKNSGSVVRKLIKYYITYKKQSILVFPEGKTYPDGPPQTFYPGSLIVAYENNIPVQPAVIKYSQDIAWTNIGNNVQPYNKNIYKNMDRLIRSKTVALVEILKPIYPQNFSNPKDFIKYIRLKMLKTWFLLYYKIKKVKILN
jgi:1-acyl-sn-glycerol-3-phosphate acyltransferase